MLERECKGTFRITKSGSIEYRIPYYDAKGTRRVKSFTGKTREECIERAGEFCAKNETKNIVIKRDATIPDIARQKLENDYVKNFCGEAGYDRGLQTLAIIERGELADVPIRKITERMLERYLDSITCYAPSVLRKLFSMVSSAFALAYDRKVIDSNLIVAKGIRCPVSAKGEKDVRAMTEEEQKRFVDALMEHKVPYGRNDYKRQILLELYTGMRMGEINALKPENIDFKRGLIHVEATISRGINSRSYYKKHPKTEPSIRDVPISKRAEPILREALEEMRDNPEGLIFYDFNKDDVIATYQVGSFFQRICRKAKVPCAGQHALRHTFATRCIEAGVPAIVLKRWLGHTNIHITMDRYVDVFERMNSSAIGQFENYIDRVKEECMVYVA